MLPWMPLSVTLPRATSPKGRGYKKALPLGELPTKSGERGNIKTKKLYYKRQMSFSMTP